MKKKKILVILLVLVIIAGAVGGGIFAYRKHQDKNTKVKVYPVTSMDWGSEEDESYSSGTVTDDKSQVVYLEEDDLIEEVYVQKGDVVAEGDPLFRYNMEEANLNLSMKELDLSTAENDLVIAQRDLERLRATTPIVESVAEEEENPPAEEPAVEEKTGNAYNIVGKSAKPFEGKGSEEEPFRFLCTSNAYVTGEYLNYLKEKSFTAIFEIHKGNKVKGAILNAWLVNGSSLEETYADDEQWSVINRTLVENEPEEDIEEEVEEVEEPEGYTAEELAAEISEKEKRIRELDISKRKIELELEQLRKASGDGVVTATVNGTVSSVQDPENLTNDGSPFLEVRGQDSLYVTGFLSELKLDEVKVGQKVVINSWETGQNFEGTITEISTTPTDSNDYMGEGNPNVSYYPYKALVEDSEGLRNGESVDLRINQSAESGSAPYVEKAFVRTENGKSYVMMEDKNHRLKKQYVKTGKTLYGQIVQILSGLDKDAYIAFPYGKGVKEGVKVQESDEMDY